MIVIGSFQLTEGEGLGGLLGLGLRRDEVRCEIVGLALRLVEVAVSERRRATATPLPPLDLAGPGVGEDPHPIPASLSGGIRRPALRCPCHHPAPSMMDRTTCRFGCWPLGDRCAKGSMRRLGSRVAIHRRLRRRRKRHPEVVTGSGRSSPIHSARRPTPATGLDSVAGTSRSPARRR